MGPNGDGRRDDGPPPGLTLRAGATSDAGVAGALHASQITEGFLSFLGPTFLGHLYRRVALAEGSFLIVAEADGQVCGFIAGSTDVSGLYRQFLRHDGLRAALGAAPRLVRGWRRVIETLRHGSAGGAGVGRGAELLAVAVDPEHQGEGVGRRLVASFLDEVADRGLGAAHVVVGADNGGAVSLYRRAGFVDVDRFELHPGTVSLLMQWDRPPATEDPG